MTLVRAKPQCTADILHAILVRHQRNDRVRGVGIQLDTVRVIVASHISDKFHDRKLHTKTESEEGDIVLARVADRINHALDTAVAKSAGN